MMRYIAALILMLSVTVSLAQASPSQPQGGRGQLDLLGRPFRDFDDLAGGVSEADPFASPDSVPDRIDLSWAAPVVRLTADFYDRGGNLSWLEIRDISGDEDVPFIDHRRYRPFDYDHRQAGFAAFEDDMFSSFRRRHRLHTGPADKNNRPCPGHPAETPVPGSFILMSTALLGLLGHKKILHRFGTQPAEMMKKEKLTCNVLYPLY